MTHVSAPEAFAKGKEDYSKGVGKDYPPKEWTEFQVELWESGWTEAQIEEEVL